MLEHDNDNLERFFQKAVRSPDVEFNESDWSKLEAKLDAEALKSAPDRPNHWKLGVASTIILLFLTGITYFFLYESNQNKLTSSPAGPTKGAVSRKENTEMSRPGKETESTKTLVQANLAPRTKKNNSLSEAQPLRVNSGESVHPSILLHEENEPGIVENGVTEAELKGSTGYSLNRSWPSVEDIAQLPAIEEEPIVGKSEKIADGVETIQETAASARWSMVFSFAPDFSKAGSSQYTSPGVALGVVAHYHLNDRFSVSTGLIRSHKKYWSYGNEYHPPKGYWGKNTNGVIPETIDGTCNVLEIPLSLQYKVAKMKRSRMFITAGFSSYFMLDESYRFSFENPNPGSKEGWDSSGPSRFLFSIANVSAGYEHDILPNVAIGIEPYAKIPVTTIGWSGLKLFSMGASFTVRYSIPKKK